MQRLLSMFIVLAVAAAWLSGCGASPAAVPSSYEPTVGEIQSPSSEDQSTGTVTPTPSPTGAGQAPIPTCTAEVTLPAQTRRVVELAKEDLARRLELSVSEVSLISVEAVDWPDTSLGCPQPGMAYAQVITSGYLIVLKAGGQRYAYHTNRGDRVVLCHTDGDSQPPSPKGITDNTPWKPIEPIEPDAISPTPRP
ncbi:MAG: hypothetical protein OEV76_01720 [Anaerolineae bacterium]|nr:hypothetical protein [Anaerolineae bacterium]